MGCRCDDCREYLRKQRDDEERARLEEERANYKPTWSDRHPKLSMVLLLIFSISMVIMCLTVLVHIPGMACIGMISLVLVLGSIMALFDVSGGTSSDLTDDEAMVIGIGGGIGLGLFGGGGFD